MANAKMLRHRSYLLGILFVISVFNGVDGAALGLVLQDIKGDLLLSDTQLGLLTGIAFAITYSIMGVAIAHWADRSDRVAIISLAAALWSLLVVGCGMAVSFFQLFVLRVGVGIGEAGCGPASQSLIADCFERSERARANAVYSMSAGVTCLIGFGIAGRLNQIYGWRMMFMLLGLPGLAVGILAWFTVREPRFGRSWDANGATWFSRPPRSLLSIAIPGSRPQPLREAASILWSNTTLRHMLLFWSVWGFLGVGLGRWWPAFFVRSYGMNTGELGAWLALIFGVGGTLGPMVGAAWAARYASNKERLQLKVAGGICCGLTVLMPFIYLVPNRYLAFGLLALYTMVTAAFVGPFWATMQTLVPESMRAATTAIFMLLASLIGNGLGSLVTGALSDALQVYFGTESLRYASLALCPGFLWMAWHLWQAGDSVTADLATRQRAHDGSDRENLAVRSSTTVSL